MSQFQLDELVGDHLLGVEGGQATDQVFEFANVARPAITLHALQRGRLHVLHRQAFRCGLLEEMAHKIGHVLGAFAQRRQTQRHDIQAEKQVLTEQALLDQDPQVLVGGRNNADIRLDRRATAHRGVFALLQHAQQARLRLHRHIADFIEKEGSALRLFETSGRT